MKLEFDGNEDSQLASPATFVPCLPRCSPLCHRILDIILPRTEKKMGGINTGSVVTSMKNAALQIGNRSVRYLVAQAMSQLSFPSDTQLAIAIHGVALPYPALFNRTDIHISPKAILPLSGSRITLAGFIAKLSAPPIREGLFAIETNKRLKCWPSSWMAGLSFLPRHIFVPPIVLPVYTKRSYL